MMDLKLAVKYFELYESIIESLFFIRLDFERESLFLTAKDAGCF